MAIFSPCCHSGRELPQQTRPMMGIGKIRQAIGTRHGSIAVLAAGLLLAACSGRPNGPPPQTTATLAVPPTAAALGHLPALGDLKGLAPAQVAALIGDPDLRRVDPPAEVWQYRNADCVLELYFYDSGTESRMVYAETRSRTPQRTPGMMSCSQGFGSLTPPTRQTRL
ncbi:MAG: hypothetical protein ACREEA_00355 [Stellaceae bacterium]